MLEERVYKSKQTLEILKFFSWNWNLTKKVIYCPIEFSFAEMNDAPHVNEVNGKAVSIYAV